MVLVDVNVSVFSVSTILNVRNNTKLHMHGTFEQINNLNEGVLEVRKGKIRDT